MEKIEVIARFTREGKLIPLEFNFGEKNSPILDIGRQWKTEEGLHILVMDFSKITYHLFLQLSDFSWYLIRDIKSSPDKF